MTLLIAALLVAQADAGTAQRVRVTVRAIAASNDPSVPAGTVVQVVQAGYMIGERVLRPALVAVSKGGGKPAPANGNEPNSAA